MVTELTHSFGNCDFLFFGSALGETKGLGMAYVSWSPSDCDWLKVNFATRLIEWKLWVEFGSSFALPLSLSLFVDS